MKLLSLVAWIFVFGLGSYGLAESAPLQPARPVSDESSNPVTLDIPVVDAPFMFADLHYGFPSMRQSLSLSTDFYQSAHSLLGGTPGEEHRRWHIWAILGFDVLTNYVPLGDSWVHEEWHRAVLTNRGIESYDDVNNFPIGSELIAVSHVGDEDLIRLKRDHPAEQVRLSSAGMEAQIAQNYEVEKRHFFDGAQTFDRILLGMNAISVTAYLSTCASGAADSETDRQNRDDGSDIPKRDFTGLDCTAWAYDLFRPNEPYAMRGVHPSGNGIDRYIKNSDLHPYEKDYLSQQVGLSLLNLVDPFLWGFDRFSVTAFDRPVQLNARLGHYLTSFGHSVEASLFVKASGESFLFTLHNGFNAARYFPGATIEWIAHHLPLEKYSVSSHLTFWSQPVGQSVRADEGSAMVEGGTELSYAWAERRSVYAGIDAKTPGWCAGDVYLERNLSLFGGVRIGVF